jgi:autotransporter translocation and assembly factor TamB
LIPSVTGQLDVREAVVTRTLAAQEGPPSPWTVPTETPSWLCDLELHAPKNVWVRNPEVSVEMGGDVILKRDRQGVYLRGDLMVLRGSYTLYNNKFRITDGRFDFATATTLRPGIYLEAFTPHRRSGDIEHKIFLSLSWPADEEKPEITLSYSEPGYSEADIWAMLGGQVVAGSAFGEEGAWNAGETAASLASNYLERILNAQMSDMTVAVESSPAGEGGRSGDEESTMTIAVGRYLSEDLYLNYRQGLRVTSARQIDIEYRLSNVLLLRSEIIQHSQRGLQGKSRQTTDEINFDIKLRWEY